MFGKSQWFRRKRFGWGLTPVTWQGWIYALCWSWILACPFIVMMVWQQYIEAGVWMMAAIGLLCWDVFKILQEMEREERKNLLFIGDDDHAKVETRKFDLHVRDGNR